MQTGLGVLRMTPEEFWNMTMIEFCSACDGFASFNGADRNAPMTRDELQDLMERYPD